MQGKQKLERVSSGLAGRAGSGECALNSFAPLSLAASLFVPLCHSRRHGGINFLCRAKLNYQVFKRDQGVGGGSRGKIRVRRGLQPAPNRARSFNSINYLNRQRLAVTFTHASEPPRFSPEVLLFVSALFFFHPYGSLPTMR